MHSTQWPALLIQGAMKPNISMPDQRVTRRNKRGSSPSFVSLVWKEEKYMKVMSKNEMNVVMGGLSWSATKAPTRPCIGPNGLPC